MHLPEVGACAVWGRSHASTRGTEISASEPSLYSLIFAADWASDSASDWAADWASDSTRFNRLKVDFRKDYFQLFLRYFSLQISVIMSNTTYLFTADGKLRKHTRL